jgi:hypothetical protein
MVDFNWGRIYGSFVWDREKELANIKKHGVDFETAAQVFKDIHIKIYIDEKHAKVENRFFCVGKVEGRVLTVRFTYREGKIRIIGAGYWRKGKRYYEKKGD